MKLEKYDSNLNLLWTKSYDSYSPEKMIYRNGYLVVSGLQCWGCNNFVSRLDPSDGSTLWNNDLDSYHGDGEVMAI